MDFQPPFCPNPACKHHQRPAGEFFVRKGFYQPACRRMPVPRFKCRECRRGFSRQTFRHDYHDHRPDLNVRLLELMTSGVGLRQSGRQLKMGVSSVQRKARKIARTCQLLHGNLMRELPDGRTFVMDEEESYEQASIRTLTMPLVIEQTSRLVVAWTVGKTRRRAKAGTKRRRHQDREEQKHGPRKDQSRKCVKQVLEQLDRHLVGKRLVLRTDQKASYGVLARQLFGDRVRHETTPGRAPRTTFNPLFSINSTFAMSRDTCSRMRRKSWLVSKQGRYLELHMSAFVVYRNYVRTRFNHDQDGRTPAVFLDFLPRQLELEQVIAWRQDLGRSSIHPLDDTGSHMGSRYRGATG